MLILSRRESESILLGEEIVLTIVRVAGDKVRIGVEAPPHVKILRNELDSGISMTIEMPKSKNADSSGAIPSKTAIIQGKPILPIANKPHASGKQSPPIQVRRAA